MRQMFTLGALLLAAGLAPAQASLRVGGLLSSAYAVQLGDGENQKSELTLLPQLEWLSPWNVELTAIARLRVDPADHLEPGQPSQLYTSDATRRALWGPYAEAELRELYAEIYLGDSYLKLGKQQIVWGQADGLKVLDRVNPQSFREFILDDFDRSRIPLWALKWEFPLSQNWNGQALLLPDQTYHEIPTAGATFAPSAPELRPALPTQSRIVGASRDVPHRPLADADAGLQLSTRQGGWDLTLNYLYHYADTPVVRILEDPDGVRLHTSFERTHTFGGSASNAFGDVTLRAELGYTTDRYVYSAAPKANQGVLRGAELAYVLGLDWMGLRDTLVSLQLFQSWFDRHHHRANRNSLESDATVLIERRFLNDTVVLRQQWIHDLDRGDGLTSTGVRYAHLANLILGIEADVFYGTAQGRFGQFDGADRVVFFFEWGY